MPVLPLRVLRHRTVEEFDYVEDLLIGVVQGGAGAHLEETARVGGGDYVGVGGFGVLHFSGE